MEKDGFVEGIEESKGLYMKPFDGRRKLLMG